jgi:hypothetical protein
MSEVEDQSVFFAKLLKVSPGYQQKVKANEVVKFNVHFENCGTQPWPAKSCLYGVSEAQVSIVVGDCNVS